MIGVPAGWRPFFVLTSLPCDNLMVMEMIRILIMVMIMIITMITICAIESYMWRNNGMM